MLPVWRLGCLFLALGCVVGNLVASQSVPSPLYWFQLDGTLVDQSAGVTLQAMSSSGGSTTATFRADRCQRPYQAWSPGMTTSATQYLTSSTSLSQLPTGNTPRTISFWVICSPDSNTRAAVSWGAGANYQSSTVLIDYPGVLWWGYNDDEVTSTSACDGANWHQVTVTYDGASVMIYIDGAVSLSPRQLPQPLSTPVSQLVIGYTLFGWRTFYGGLDEVQIWNIALNPSQVQNLYQQQQFCPDQLFTQQIPTIPMPNQQSYILSAEMNGVLYAGFGANPCGTSALQFGNSTDNGVTWQWWLVSNSNFIFSGNTLYPTDSAMVAFNNQLIVAGGTTCDVGYWSTVWTSADGKSWASYSNLGSWTARSALSMVVSQLPSPRIYILGGQSGAGLYNDVWWTSNPSGTWNSLGNAPWKSSSDLPVVVTDSGRLVIQSTGLWISNVGATSWTELAYQPTDWFGVRMQGSLANVAGNLVFLGGRNSTGTSYNDVWVSMDECATWLLMTGAAEFTPRYMAKAIAIDNALIVMGGFSDSWNYDVWQASL